MRKYFFEEGWMLPFGVFIGLILSLMVIILFTGMTLDPGIAALIAGTLAIGAGALAFAGATRQAQATVDAAKQQSYTQIQVDRNRQDQAQQNLAVAFKAIATEVAEIMQSRRDLITAYVKADRKKKETDPEVYKDTMRSLIVTTHRLLVPDLATIAVLGPDVAEAVIALYSYTNRYDRFIDECLAYSGIPVRYLRFYFDLCRYAKASKNGATELVKIIEAWQSQNPPIGQPNDQ